MTSRRITVRVSALHEAVALHTARSTGLHGTSWLTEDTLRTADAFYDWLTAPSATADFTITADPPVDRPTHQENPMSLTFPDTQQDTLRITGDVDAEGAAVTDTFTWTVDNPAVLTLTPAADTLSCLIVPGTTAGSAVVTATASDGVARTFAVDVTTGTTAAFEITSDGPVDRPAPAAPAAPEPAPGA